MGRTPLAVVLVCVLTMVCAPLAHADVFGSLSTGEPGASGQYLVKFAAGTSEAEQAAALSDAGVQDLSYVAPLRLHSVVLPEDAQAALDQLSANASVERVEAEQSREASAVPNDPAFDSQWSLARIGWDQLYGSLVPSGSATVAVLDTGVDAGHADLAANVVPGTSILDPGSNGASDSNGHGTQMAGIVAASTDNGEGMAGIGYAGVNVMPVTVLDSQGVGQDGDIINGVIWAADHGADVILMSFSSPDFSPSLQDAIDYAWSQGAVLVGAAGNDGSSAAHFPAGDRGVVGVANTDESDALNSSSNYGDGAFIAAPGTGIHTTANGGGYTNITGTSASAAAVAGAAALMRASSPDASNGTIVGRLARNADPVVGGGGGNGRLNLARAADDTSSDSVQPAGAAPVGGGGPIVGPYTVAVDKFWLGCASTSWGTGAVANGNWTTSNTATCSGGAPTAGNTAPAGAGDTATIKATGPNFPILVATDAITVTSFTINASAAVNAAAGSLTSSAGNADIAVNGTLLIGAGTVVVGRDLTVSGTLAMTGGSLTVPRDFLGAGVTTMNDGTLRVGRNFGFTATGWSATGGTVEFTTASSGNGNQLAGVPTAIQFNHLSVSGANDANLDQGGKTLNLTGNYSNTSTNANDLTTGSFVFNGGVAQTIGGTQAQRFNNLSVAKSAGTATLGLSETVGGNLAVLSGTLDLSTFTLNHTLPAAGNIAIANGAALKIGGTGTFPINYLTRTIGATSTVEYNGANQAVPSVGYGHLILSGTGTKTTAAAATTVSGNLTVSGTAAAVAGNTVSVAGNVTLGTGTSFDAANFSHSFRGNFTNNGTFTKGTSTVTFDGLSPQTIGGANPTTFNNLTIAQAVSLAGVDVTADGTLALNNVISTGANKVIANGAGGGAGGVTRSASGLVNGNLEKPVGTGTPVARTFQVGTGTTYTPVDLTFATVGTAGRLVAKSTASDHPNIASSGIQPAKSVNRYWTLTPNGTLAFTTYDGTFTFVAGDVDAGATTAAFVVRRHDGTNWHTTTAGTRTATSTQATGVAALSDFAVGEADLTGPVTSSVAASPSPTNTPPTVTAQVSDTTTGGSNVAGAEYFIDVAGAAGTGTAMTASDGTFNSVTEGVTATLSAAQFDGLSDGQHTVYVRGRDAGGNWGATDSATFVKDTTGPTTSITFPADGGVYNTAGWNAGCPTPGLCGTATDDAGVGSVQVSIRRVSDDAYWNGFGFAAGPETYVAATGTTSWSYALAASVLTDGDSYAVLAKATDGLGNLSTVASNGFTYDTTRPSVTVEQAVGQDDPTSELPIHFTAEFSEPVDFDDADVSLGGTSGQAGATVVVTEGPDNVYDIAVDGITDGTLTASVADGAVEDAAGNGNTESTSTDNEVTYDNTDPESEASSPAFSNASAATIPVDYTASDNLAGLDEVELWAKKDSGPWELADTDPSPGISGQFLYTPSPGDGTYRFYTIAIDNAGNREAVPTEVDAVTVKADTTTLRDTVAPDPSLTAPPAFTNDDTPEIAGTAGTQGADSTHSADDGHVTVKVFEGATLLQTHSNVPVDSGDGSFSVDATHLDDGEYTARVDQSDAAGNSDFDERDFEVDTVRPDVTIDQALGQADPTNDQPIHFTAVFTEPVTGFDQDDVTLERDGWRWLSDGGCHRVRATRMTSPSRGSARTGRSLRTWTRTARRTTPGTATPPRRRRTTRSRSTRPSRR